MHVNSITSSYFLFFSHTETWFREDTEHSRAQGSVGYGDATHSFRANINNLVRYLNVRNI